MLLNKQIELKWNYGNKKLYQNKGYVFTNYGDNFLVDIEDLAINSHFKVKVKCDNCGKIMDREYREYLKRHDDYGDLCTSCCGIKIKRTLINKYGGVGLQSSYIKNKVQNTNIDKYGVPIPFQNKEIYKKIRKTQVEKYGGIGLASESTKEKINNSILEKYGVINPSQSEEIKEKKKITCFKNNGVFHPLQNKDIAKKAISKARKTIYNNGNIPVSKNEKELVQMLISIYGEKNCIPSYFCGNLVFDCLLVIDNQKIDVEYDGWYWHKDRQEQDRKRNYAVINLGYKVLRIKSKNLLPTCDEIINAVNYLIKENHHFKEIILDI